MEPARRQALRYLNLFRLVLAGMFIVIGTDLNLGQGWPGLFKVVVAFYAVTILLLGFPDAESRLGLRSLVVLQGVIDVTVLSVIMWVSGGFSSGMPELMMIMLAGFGLVSEGRMVLLMAAFATIMVLTENVWRVYAGTGSTEFFLIGLNCIGFFGIAIVARMLALRASANAQLAIQRGAALARQELVNERIIRDMHDGVIVLAPDGVVRQANPSACTLLGCDSLEGRVLPEIDPRFVDVFHVGADGEGHLLQLGQFNRRLLRCRVIDAEGDALLYLTDLEDIQRSMQQNKLAALGRLTASMAHEIRNPLSAVIQAAELLREEKRSDMQARLARIIHDNSLRIEHMIRDVLALGKREQSMPEAVPLAAFVNELFETHGLAGPRERAVFTADIDPAITLGVDRAHLHQILDNLLTNARRYCSGRPGAVRVNAEAMGNGQVKLHVRDDGPGIATEACAHLFEPFFTTHAKGTGLGLYIARELADANGISLESMDDGPGAHFMLVGWSQP
ncbi:MAG: PAS domain-containing sensor histidine kinase [Azoarcus sp.]|jgi:two-component system sensor histidine kinase PilS (NtrC family)|nr:PAS domain-containing sensor histidine kinase [Azoarcus sp.]